MATVSVVEKNVTLSGEDVLRYQLITHCFLHRIHISASDLELLVFLARSGMADLNEFCNKACDRGIFASAQTVRNAINRAARLQLILKTGSRKKMVQVHPGLQLQFAGNILLMYKFLSLEPYESKATA